jgi:hypothetical protein
VKDELLKQGFSSGQMDWVTGRGMGGPATKQK